MALKSKEIESTTRIGFKEIREKAHILNEQRALGLFSRQDFTFAKQLLRSSRRNLR